MEVDAGAGRRRDPDHEVARRGGHLHREPHEVVHRQHLERSAADAEQARQQAGAEHRAEPGAHAGRPVLHVAVEAGVVVGAFELEAHRQRVDSGLGGDLHVELAQGHQRRVRQGQPEDQLEDGLGYETDETGADDRAADGGHGEEEPDAHVAEPRPEIGGGRAARRGDDGDDAGAHRVAQVDAVEHGEDRHEHDAAAEAEDRADGARHRRGGEDGDDEEPRLHLQPTRNGGGSPPPWCITLIALPHNRSISRHASTRYQLRKKPMLAMKPA